jgi:hypothetical protein
MSGDGFEVLGTHCIEDIGQENWDKLSARRSFSSYSWYRFGERAMTGATPLYICVSRRGEALARAAFIIERLWAASVRPWRELTWNLKGS